MAKKKRRNRRRLIVIGGVAAAGTGAAAAARAQRKGDTEQAGESPDESRMRRVADRVKSALDAGKAKLLAAAHKLRHPTGTGTN